jgi:UDP-glucose 4-epimerase
VNVLVTGGTGFIGSRLIKQLRSQIPGANIACLVRRSTTSEAEFNSLRAAGVHIIEGDLDDPSVSREPAPPADRVYHLAANIDTGLGESELRVNDLGTEYLLRWLAPVSRGMRIIYTSTVAVHDRDGVASGPITETSPFTPRTPYGVTKLRGEEIITSGAEAGGYAWTILRLATVYGPASKPGGIFDSLFAMTAAGSLGARIAWPGLISIIHVDDVASLLVDIADRPGTANEVFCVANPGAPNVGELAQHIGIVSGHPVRPLQLPNWTWSLIRRLIWHRGVQFLIPKRAALAFWRLSLIVDDGFWYDTRKLQRVWADPPRDLDAALREMLAQRPVPVS